MSLTVVAAVVSSCCRHGGDSPCRLASRPAIRADASDISRFRSSSSSSSAYGSGCLFLFKKCILVKYNVAAYMSIIALHRSANYAMLYAIRAK